MRTTRGARGIQGAARLRRAPAGTPARAPRSVLPLPRLVARLRPSPLARATALALLAAGCDAARNPVAPVEQPLASYPGFDIALHPGEPALRAWRAPDSPYRWIGFYLVAPCHRDASFSGQRLAIAAQGYGTAVLYVGQQTWEGVPNRLPADDQPLRDRAPAPGGASVASPATPRTLALWRDAQPAVGSLPAAAQPTCSRTLLSSARGTAEGNDAIARTAAEGFPRGTAVFLDLEPMTTIPAEMRDYYRAWVRALLVDGRYRPAVYVHWRNAEAVHADVRALHDEFRAGTPPVWVARSAGFSLTRPPTDAGFAFATVWQGALDVSRTWNGVTRTIDENVASRPSPSDPPTP